MRSIAIFSILATMLVAQQQPQEFPLEKEFNSTLSGSGGVAVKTVFKVTKNGDIYTYFYSIKNEGTQKTLVIWEAVSKALYYGRDTETIWELKPNENTLIIIESKDSPTQIYAELYAYTAENRKNFEREVKEAGTPEVKIKLSKSSSPVYSRMGGGTNVALPSSFIRSGR